jgi:hypothetical protein
MSEDEKKEQDEEKDVVVKIDYEPAENELAETIKRKILTTMTEKLGGRGNVVMTRIDDEDLKKIDALVDVEVFKSRSEAAAYFIKEGVQARKDIFQDVMSTVNKIKELKDKVKKSLTRSNDE